MTAFSSKGRWEKLAIAVHSPKYVEPGHSLCCFAKTAKKCTKIPNSLAEVIKPFVRDVLVGIAVVTC